MYMMSDFVRSNIMITEIKSKTILNHVKQPDPWFGLKYNMNLYRGCQHQCIYCDSRSDCYRIEDFSQIEVKINALDLLEDALPRKRMIGTIGFGSMNDPYMPVENKYRLTGQALDIINRHGFPVHILTKSDLVIRDMEILKDISRIYGAVSFTITTADDQLAAKLEPGAPLPSTRYKAMKKLADSGILTGITMMPILPFIEDDPENIRRIIREASDNGASYIIPAFGISLRPGSRDFFYNKLDKSFPGVKEKYINHFGKDYNCSTPNWRELNDLFQTEIESLGIMPKMPVYTPIKKTGINPQIALFSK
jgi:DNA repair photolyase